MAISIGVLLLLIVSNFYGLYTNKFYFLKVDNYIFPLLSLVHFSFLNVLHAKIHERDIVEPQLRNLEYVMYGILLVYIFKVLDTTYILLSYSDYQTNLIPDTFIPVGAGILVLQLLLISLTVVAFAFRRQMVGPYSFDQINDNIDSWQ